jgi:sigma-B regulation protein RsbU (phosphoserine phosphatase)
VLNAGDRLLVYTDGVIDTQNKNGDFFGNKRLIDMFLNNRNQVPSDILRKSSEWYTSIYWKL